MSLTGNVQSASQIQMDYMKLLITQMQNQNPLEPLDNNEMASQLAQFSELSQLENMNTSFSSILERVNQNYANSLIGKEVSVAVEAEDGTVGVVDVMVDEVVKNPEDGGLMMRADKMLFLAEDIVSVRN